jgi:hypothetical protein
MVARGFTTGWRPSMMRPLRREGPSADVLSAKNVVLARRSQTRGDEVREATKNSDALRITLPPDATAVLRWHADRLPPGRMQESDFGFPSEIGGFRIPGNARRAGDTWAHELTERPTIKQTLACSGYPRRFRVRVPSDVVTSALHSAVRATDLTKEWRCGRW